MATKNLQVVLSGERTNAEGKAIGNKILLSASHSDYSLLRPHLEYLNLPHHLVIHEAGEKLKYVYFTNRGLISLIVAMKDGNAAETGLVGNESFTGTPAAVGLGQKHAESGGTNRGGWLSGGNGSVAQNFGIQPRPSVDLVPLRNNLGNAGCAGIRVQSAARYQAAPCAVVPNDPG